MKLSTKLKLSFIIIAIVPMILMVSAVAVLGTWQMRAIKMAYGADINNISSLSNPVGIFCKMNDNLFEEMKKTIENDNSKLESAEYVNSINKRLKAKFSFMVITKNDRIAFDGGEKEQKKVLDDLPTYEECMSIKNGFYVKEDTHYVVKEKTFKYNDGSNGVVFIFTSLDEIIPQVKRLFMEVIIAAVIVVVLTGVTLTFWIHKSVMNPMNKLKLATRRISEGDLDFTLEADGNDEFGELCKDFEEMRIRLKQTAEDRIRDEEESKELVSNISHDLKTPITAIKGYVEGIMDGVADTPEKMDKYIRTIYNKANDMDKLIAELTTYSKIDTNRMPYNFTKVNVDEYFLDCIDELHYELDSRNITLSYFNYVDKDVIIIADIEQLKRVINNIVSNSVKYIGDKQGVLNIRINDEGDFIRVEIEDNGKGIEQKDLPFIFDRFYRTDSSRNSNQGGSGIGLSIVKKIIEAHGGKIWATSKIDTGTTMHFVIRKYVESVVNVKEDV